jgi:hypothetical protein
MSNSPISYGRWEGFVADDETTRIIVYAEKGALFEGLARLLEHHVPGTEVIVCDNLLEMAAGDPCVKLLLVHTRPGEGFYREVPRYQHLYPNASVALLVDHLEDEDDWRALTENSIVQGCVPLNLKL